MADLLMSFACGVLTFIAAGALFDLAKTWTTPTTPTPTDEGDPR